MSSSPGTESVMTCTGCGASIYQEHIDRGLAGMWAGAMLCPLCLAEKKKTNSPAPGTGDLAPLSLVEAPDTTDQAGRSSLHGYSGVAAAEGAGAEVQPYQRPLNQAGKAATRIRTFHAKLTEGAIRHLDQQVNTWLDGHPDVEIKFANTTVGVWEGKHPEPHLILSVFY